VGQLTGARILLAGSVTESGSSFLLNGRLVDVETGVVIGAQSVSVPKEELITKAEAFKYEYVTRYGLGFQTLAGADIPFSGILLPSPYRNRGILPSPAFSPDRRLDECDLGRVPIRGV
jgi:hypothetical protein